MFGYIHKYAPSAGTTPTGIHRVYDAIRSGLAHRSDITMVGKNPEESRGFKRSFLEDGLLAKNCYPNCMALVFDTIPLTEPEFAPTEFFWGPSFHALPRYDRILVPSQHVKKSLVELLGVDEERIQVQLLGVDRSIFKPLEIDRQAWKQEHGFDESGLLIGHVSAGYARKNIGLIFEAMRGIPDAQFVKVGRDDLTDFLARKHGVSDRVFFLDPMSDEKLAEFYNAIDIFAFPSLSEGFGLPALEAQACGCPTITSMHSGLEEVTGVGASAVDPLSVGMMESELRSFIPRDRMGPLDDQWFSQFDWKNIAAAVDNWLT